MIVFLDLILCIWVFYGLDLITGVLFRIPVLKKQKTVPLKTFPKVSILFAARNEEVQIPKALSSLLALDYPDYEVIAVNDRSTDGTLQAMQAFSADPRLKILNVETLPEGWLGKNHALQSGYRKASGQWLLFTDADVVFEPETLRCVMKFMEARKLDHIALLPRLILNGLLEKVFTTSFGLAFYLHFRPWAATNPKSKAHIGVGAFNLVRRQTYEKLGTHEGFRLNVLDDMELGRRVKESGFRQSAVFGHELIGVPWVEGWDGILRSLEKNGFAGFNYSLSFLIGITFLSFFMNVLPYITFVTASGTAWFLSLGIILTIFFVYLALQRHHQKTLSCFLYHPLGCMLVLFVVWRSALLALKAGGIRWRDTFYSLASLREKK